MGLIYSPETSEPAVNLAALILQKREVLSCTAGLASNLAYPTIVDVSCSQTYNRLLGSVFYSYVSASDGESFEFWLARPSEDFYAVITSPWKMSHVSCAEF